jgi:radical SAM protein with 4Fe4S-binding SPASM domain
MNQLEQSIIDLKKLYDTAGPYYLSDFFQLNGGKNLYDFLMSVYQVEYKNNFRILIVQDCQDTYDYQDTPGQAIRELQKYASQIDISNFFILVITGNKNIESELDQARILYSTDTNRIQSFIVDGVEYSTTKYKKQDTFCVLPWMHLYVGTDGNVLPCCVADSQFPLGNIEEQSIDEISKSQPFNQLRANMLNGRRSKECNRCYNQEDANLSSARTRHNDRWSDIKDKNLDPTGVISSFDPVYLDIRLNNICNLKCRMCNGYFSSAIAQEEIELFNKSKYMQSSLQLQQRKTALVKILKYLPNCEKIYFAGGEPLLSSEHYDILDALIDCENTNLEIIYNTNFTNFKYRDRNVLDLWKHFSNITVGASLDAHGVVAEYVRHGTNWSAIESNLDLIKSQCPHVNLTVTSTVGLLNVTSLIELQKNWHTSNKLNISKFSQSVMIGPLHLTVSALPTEHKHRLEKPIKDHIIWCQENNAIALAKQWNDVLEYMWSQDNSHYMTEFRRLTQITDHHRNTSLSSVLPEFKNLL